MKIKRTIKISVTIIFIIVSIGAYFLLIAPRFKSTPLKEQKTIIKQVGKLVILPQGEDPTLAKVEDVNKLTDPYLKHDAQNGDKILLYYTAQKVYLYRPKLNRVVGMYPLILDPSLSQAIDAKVLVRTGNGKAEVAESLRKQIAATYPSIKVHGVEPATRQDYPNTIVIDLTDGSKYDLVTNIIKTTGASRGILPNGEPKPDNVDILIITGKQ